MIKVKNIESMKPLDTVEKMNLKMMTNLQPINEIPNGSTFEVGNRAVLTCFMEGNPNAADEDKRKDKEYNVFVYISPDRQCYYSTSSQSLDSDIETMLDEIFGDMPDAKGVVVEVKQHPSKNYKGNFFRAGLVSIIE